MLAVIIIQALFYNLSKLVGDKAKRLISKRVIQENKARQIFGKTNISHPPPPPPTHTRTCIRGGSLLRLIFLPYCRRTQHQASTYELKNKNAKRSKRTVATGGSKRHPFLFFEFFNA